MRRLAPLFAALLAASTAFAADAPTPPMPLESVLLYPVQSEIDLDANGDVTGLRITTPIADDVRAGLDPVIRAWDIEPVLDDGQPVAANAKVDIVLAARPAANIDQVWVDSLQFREVTVAGRPPERKVVVTADSLRSPKYPPGVYYAGVSGRVLVALQLDAKGKVLDAQPVQTALYDVNGKPEVLSDAVAQFQQAALRSAKTWRMDVAVPPGVTPDADDLTAYVPVQFTNQGFERIQPGHWRLVVRTQRVAPKWLPVDPERTPVGVADVGGNGPAQANDDVRLRSGGAGDTLPVGQ